VTRRLRRRSGLELSVNNEHCHRYGYCTAEAPELFQLLTNGGLRYRRAVGPEQVEQARAAVRCCPMLAIALEER
jgi:ferredoxin